MNLSKERMDHITRLVERGFPLKTDEVQDLHGMNYHLYCLCDTYQAMKIRAENEAETLKAENGRLLATIEQQTFLIGNLRNDVREAIEIDCEQDAVDAIAEIERPGTPGSVIRDMNDELVDLRTDAERYRWLRSRDLETISDGGVFAGMTPQNMVLNEETLDEAVDAAMNLSLLIVTPLNPA